MSGHLNRVRARRQRIQTNQGEVKGSPRRIVAVRGEEYLNLKNITEQKLQKLRDWEMAAAFMKEEPIELIASNRTNLSPIQKLMMQYNAENS